MRILLPVLFIFFSLMSYAQMDVIELSNPSFEETPRKGGAMKGIIGWYDCGILNFPKESAPDIHPGGFWNVDKEAYDGETYLGLVVRDNDTWESVSQRVYLEEENGNKLLAGNCYSFSMAVHRAEEYISGSRLQLKIDGNKRQIFNYNTPTLTSYNGHVLIDNLSDVIQIACED